METVLISSDYVNLSLQIKKNAFESFAGFIV